MRYDTLSVNVSSVTQWRPSHTVQVRHALGGSVYCMPAALSAITGLNTLETTNLYKKELGDITIKGIYFPVVLKILKSLGYKYQEWGFTEHGGLYLCFSRSHVEVWWDGKLYDNFHPTGTNQGTTGKKRFTEIFRVWREGEK